jgi:crotonobetainyl-CoA:carnitine CoA-transferase CaiB-like acyl-CoA transferase
VIKIESRDFPDVTRLYVPPRTPELGIQPQLSPWFTDWNAGKKFVSLDLTETEGADLARRLTAKSDVVIENYTTGVLEKFGLGYEDLSRINPLLVMFGTTGYGNEGPNRQYISWGPNIEALSGIASLTGFPGHHCTMTQFAYPDPLTALHGLFAILCALDYRDRTGKGQYINLCQFELTLSAVGELVMEYLANGHEPEKLGNRSRHNAPQGCYRCRGDDRWIALSVCDDSAWKGLCKVLGRREWIDDPRFSTAQGRFENGDKLDREIKRFFAERVDYDIMAELQAEGVAAGVVQNTEDQLYRDPQLAARDFFERIPHELKGEVIANGIPLGLTGTPGSTPHAGEARGQDNEYVFRELLGLDHAEYGRLVASGAIETFDDER